MSKIYIELSKENSKRNGIGAIDISKTVFSGLVPTHQGSSTVSSC